MPLIDERGRVLGRLNLVDAAVVMLLVLLLPAAYLSYVLFRDPPARLTAVVPSVLRQGVVQQIEVRGEHFRPYMRVSFNNTQGRTFLFYSANSAFVQIPDLPAGKYDVVLYDYMQEVARLPGALSVDAPPPPPTIAVEVGGMLTGLTSELVKLLQVGHHFPEGAAVYSELVEVGVAEPEMWHIKTGERSMLTVPGSGLLQLPVRIRMDCVIDKAPDGSMRCAVNGIPLVSDANVGLNGLSRLLNLRVTDVKLAR